MAVDASTKVKPIPKYTFSLRRHWRLLAYLAIIPLPYLATYALNMDSKGAYVSVISLINLIAMMAFFVQFPLGSRLKKIPLLANIDWNISNHKTVGKWLGVLFLLHPMLVLAPRFLVSTDDAITSIVTTVTAPQMLTGIIAWVGLILWILSSIYKNKLPMKYETWRLTHAIGFIAITILATLHLTSVGSHGQFQSQFNIIWWVLCTTSVAIVGYNYLIKPAALSRRPFKLLEVRKISNNDWSVTIENSSQHSFDFEAGQFVWLNTSGSVKGVNEHPFSIASSKKDLPSISFVIRELGDYTTSLGELKPGQDVYIDGPYGSISLKDSEKAKGITLIAGGAGIGPMLSLLRELADRNESRQVRLIYGNREINQMVFQQEIRELESKMFDFSQQLVCIKQSTQEGIYTGVIDKVCIEKSIDLALVNDWAVYFCGPEGMIDAVKKNAIALNIPCDQLHYEQLSF